MIVAGSVVPAAQTLGTVPGLGIRIPYSRNCLTMKITKYLHSCLLLEHDVERLLFDPGSFSFADGLVKPGDFRDIDYLVITHDHPDHLHLPAIRKIVANNDLEIIGNAEVAEKLRAEGLEVTEFNEGKRQLGAFHLEAFPVKHQPILSDRMPTVTAFLINGTILNPGDSFSDDLLRYKGCDLLFCPIMAPFLTEVQAYAFIQKMEPRAVFAVHDGYAKAWFVEERQRNFRSSLEGLGVTFYGIVEPGGSVDI